MLRQIRAPLMALILSAVFGAPHFRAVGDIGESREDPLIEVLKKTKPPLWTEKEAKIAAMMEREQQCTLVDYLKFRADGKPDVQFDDQGKLLIHDKAGNKLVEVITLPASRLKQDLAIVIATTNVNKLNPEARWQLNLAVYGPGCENGPKTPKDKERANKRSEDATDELMKYREAKRIEQLQQKWRQDDFHTRRRGSL